MRRSCEISRYKCSWRRRGWGSIILFACFLPLCTPKSLIHSFISYILVEGLLCDDTVLNGGNGVKNQPDGVTVPRADIPCEGQRL